MDPPFVVTALRYDHNERKPRRILADSVRNPNVGGEYPVVPTRAHPVEKQGHWPLLFRIEVLRNVDLVAMQLSIYRNGAVEETSLVLAGKNSRGGNDENRTQENAQARMAFHDEGVYQRRIRASATTLSFT
jgi:hypothetical protein